MPGDHVFASSRRSRSSLDALRSDSPHELSGAWPTLGLPRRRLGVGCRSRIEMTFGGRGSADLGGHRVEPWSLSVALYEVAVTDANLEDEA